jgi:hypothetical protein
MRIETALIIKLKATSGVTSLTGSRIYYINDVIQKVEYPYVVIQTVSNPAEYVLSGSQTLRSARIQLSIISDTYTECQSVADAIKTAIHYFKGTMGGTGGVDVAGCFLDGENDIESEPELFGIAVDYLLKYSE